MSLFLWTPFSISYLVQLIIGLLMMGYFAVRLFIEFRRGQLLLSTVALSAMVFGLTGYLGLLFLKATLHPDLAMSTLPWMAVSADLALLAFLLFAYTFPSPLVKVLSIEAFVIALAGAGFFILEVLFAFERMRLQTEGYIEYRPSALDLPQLFLVFWMILVFWRQYLRASRSETASLFYIFRQILRFITGRELPRKAQAVRAFLLVALAPLSTVVLLALRSYWLIGGMLTEIILCWLTLGILSIFSLVYLNYVAERTSFMIKLVGITLTVMLVILSTLSWIIGSTYAEAYKSENFPEEGVSLRFQPMETGGYQLNRTAFRFDEDIGDFASFSDPEPLSFPFPFYGETYHTIYLHTFGYISFDGPPSYRHMQDRMGGHASIMPMIVGKDFWDEAPMDGSKPSGLYINRKSDRILVTWHKGTAYADMDAVYTYQTALYPNGVIEFSYKTLPDVIQPDVFAMQATPLHLGITPGWLKGPLQRVDLSTEIPSQGAANQGLIADFRLEFLTYLNRIYSPVALFTMMITCLILVLVPFFYRNSLVLPLNRLLAGVRRFRADRYDGPIPVTFRDEIGFLTDAFNKLTEAQRDLVQTLEEKVEQRTQSALGLAEENARLAERNHLSGELHDAVSQSLFSATLIADTLQDIWQRDPKAGEEALDRMRQLNRGALAEMRLLLMELRPGRLTEQTFGPLLHELANSTSSANAFDVNLNVENDQKLPSQVQITFYRIAQESLSNIAKHAQATSVDIYFDAIPNQCLLTISDNGKGFDLNDVPVGHMGLQIMRERVQRIGGHLEISSRPGKGTTLTLIWYAEGGDE